MFGKKNCWSKQNLSERFFWSKKCLVKKTVVKKSCLKKILVQRKCGQKKSKQLEKVHDISWSQ